MSDGYFVAEDLIHTRIASGSFESACGWEYDPALVDWSGPYEPSAWSPCDVCAEVNGAVADEDSSADPLESELVKMRTVRVIGSFAVDDLAHVSIETDESVLLALCGLSYAGEPDWIGSDWPWTWDRCVPCREAIGQAVPEVDDDVVSTEDAPHLAANRRLWAVTKTGAWHRASDFPMRLAMCGVAIPAGAVPSRHHSGRGCSKCDHAVGAERRGARVEDRQAQTAKTLAKHTKRTPKVAVRSTKRSGSAPRPAGSGSRVGGDDVSLFGRRMVVPIRIVSGGAPGLGKRR